jgi:hypothetical protein
MPSFAPIVTQAYLEILGRPPDPGGLAAYNEAMNRGLTEAQLRETLLRSEEYANKYPGGQPPPPQPPPGEGALRVDGNRFVDQQGNELKLLGAIHCCDAPDTPADDAKVHWWPLVDEETLDVYAAHKLNFTHIRLGPFTVSGEDDPNYVGYLTMPATGRVDLEQWFEHFWGRCRTVCAWCRDRGIYLELDLVDRWVRHHGESDMPNIDPWRHNIQELNAGGLVIFEAAPTAIHERWIRKCVEELGEFQNVMFNVGNEGFKRFSLAWEFGVRDIVKDELRVRGFGDRLVGTNTHDPAIEESLDYATRHKNVAQRAETWPVMVTEYRTLSPEEVLEQVRIARDNGTSFHFWMGGQTTAQRAETLAGLRRVVGG